MRLARILGAVGRTCITAGVLILLFVAYQLWGTGIRTAQAQNQLEDDFEAVLEEAVDQPTTTTTTTEAGDPPDHRHDPTTGPAPEGEATARIVIPAIGVDKIVVEGVSLADLKKGPGHYPETPLPGQEGNAAIAGHRTTYGAPFHRLDELQAGRRDHRHHRAGRVHLRGERDPHRLADRGRGAGGQGRQPPHAVRPATRSTAPGSASSWCRSWPRTRSPCKRPSREDAPPPAALDDIDGEGAPAWPAILLGTPLRPIWLVAWLVGRRWRKWPSYLICLPFFMVTLFFFFEEFSRLLPSNF